LILFQRQKWVYWIFEFRYKQGEQIMGLMLLLKWRTLSLISVVALGLCLCLPGYGQRPPKRQKAGKAEITAPCTLELKASPTIRGLRLGMPVKEFLKMFPSASESSDSKPLVGAITYEIRQEENPNFAKSGVQVNLIWFVDEALSSIGFIYPEYDPVSIDDFVRQAAAKLALPAVGWNNSDGKSELKCQGFTVVIGREGEENPYLTLTDNASDAKVKAREKDLTRKETEEQRLKEQERRIFKP
jgi:hypothetical protein